MNSSELLDFKKDVGMMSDEELSRYLDESGSQFSFTSSEIDSLQEKLNAEIKTEKHRRNIRRFLTACAAVLVPTIIVCSLVMFSSYNDLKKYQQYISQVTTISTDKGEFSNTILPDGSKIELGPKSSLSYSLETFNSTYRQIEYSGEGRFNIAKNPDAPFTLKISDFEIRVLGTIFSVYAREDKDKAEIHLEEGSLQVVSMVSDCTKLLSPGETAIINSKTGEITVIDDSVRCKRLAGKSTIYFSSAQLAEVAGELELYYGRKIRIDEKIKDVYFTGSLPTDNLTQAIYILEHTLGISIIFDDKDNSLRFNSK